MTKQRDCCICGKSTENKICGTCKPFVESYASQKGISFQRAIGEFQADVAMVVSTVNNFGASGFRKI